MAEFKGIDVSSAQGIIDWKKVKESGAVDFAILRSSYGWQAVGDSQFDKQFMANVKGCEENKIPYGIYHYSYCVRPENARKEAQYFLKAIKAAGANPDYPLWFDIEDETQVALSKAVCTKIAAEFCDEIEKAGYRIGIYSYKNFLESKLEPWLLEKYDVWVAQVDVANTTYKGDYTMWQRSWHGKVDGIAGEVDLDICYKDYINKVNPPTGGEPTVRELLKLAESKMLEVTEILKRINEQFAKE